MKPLPPRVPEPDDARADRTVRAPQFLWAILAILMVAGFVAAALLFSKPF